MADRFIAGETAAEALEHARLLNDDGVGAILDLLGEHYTELEPAAEDAAAYRQLAPDIGSAGLDACLWVKPTQFGLGVDVEAFESNVAGVIAAAREPGVIVWLDMEDRTTAGATLDAFERFVAEHPAMEVCLQARLRRTSTG